MPKLQVIMASTREQRQGPAVARWFMERATEHGKFAASFTDLRELGLPLLDEPNHPTQRKYQHEHTKRWSAIVGAADAFVFVVPEYNFSMPPALLNAIDYLFHEWCYKPASFVGYGGVSGGLRSIEFAKPLLTAVNVMPIYEAVSLPFFTKQIDADGKFDPGDGPRGKANAMLDALLRWSNALATMRA
jgi:NAD(P)H-dependent FMN reductase